MFRKRRGAGPAPVGCLDRSSPHDGGVSPPAAASGFSAASAGSLLAATAARSRVARRGDAPRLRSGRENCPEAGHGLPVLTVRGHHLDGRAGPFACGFELDRSLFGLRAELLRDGDEHPPIGSRVRASPGAPCGWSRNPTNPRADTQIPRVSTGLGCAPASRGRGLVNNLG